MTRPSIYELGASPEILMTFTDTDDQVFVPTEVRLSIEQPDGVIITFSGADMNTLSGSILSVIYNPPILGWYEYESWGKDNANRQTAQSSGFEVVDSVMEG